MPFIAKRRSRGKEKEVFESLGEPEELQQGSTSFHAGDSSLVLLVQKGGEELEVDLDQSRGNVDVRPFGESALVDFNKHGIVRVVFQAGLLREGTTVAKLLDTDDSGALYQAVIQAGKPKQ